MSERSRSRDDDDRGSRRGRDRDDDDRGSRRSRGDEDAPRRGRDRDDDDRPARGRGRDDDDRGSRRSFEYRGRSADQSRKRSEQSGGDFDRILQDGIKMFKPNDGENTIRIVPPTWDNPEHFGLDVFVHYGIGPDRQTYLCRHKMLGEKCPICEERADAQRNGDEKLAKQLEPKKRVLVYVIDRDHEKEGPQAWAMPWTLDRDIAKVSRDRKTGEVLAIDHPEEGYDILFEKKGAKDRTEYLGVAVDRRDSPLGKDAWLDFAVDNPLDKQLVYFDYDHIAKVFGGGGGGSSRGRDDDRDDDRGRRGSRDDDDRPARGRGRDDDDRGSRRKTSEPEHTWEQVHDMTSRELDALAEEAGVNPSKFDSDEELADAICEAMDIKKSPARRSPGRDEDERPARSRGDDDTPRRGRSRGDDEDVDDRLARMRSRGD